MTQIDQSVIGKVISFQLYPAALITDSFSDVKVIGLTNYEAASAYISPAQLHATVYPTLPTNKNIPNDYRLYEYVLLRKADGKLTALGVPWIKEETITVSSTVELQVIIRGKSIDDIPRLRQILSQNNFLDFEVSMR